MALPDPNICSQKWGNGWEGAAGSTSIDSSSMADSENRCGKIAWGAAGAVSIKAVQRQKTQTCWRNFQFSTLTRVLGRDSEIPGASTIVEPWRQGLNQLPRPLPQHPERALHAGTFHSASALRQQLPARRGIDVAWRSRKEHLRSQRGSLLDGAPSNFSRLH